MIGKRNLPKNVNSGTKPFSMAWFQCKVLVFSRITHRLSFYSFSYDLCQGDAGFCYLILMVSGCSFSCPA